MVIRSVSQSVTWLIYPKDGLQVTVLLWFIFLARPILVFVKFDWHQKQNSPGLIQGQMER